MAKTIRAAALGADALGALGQVLMADGRAGQRDEYAATTDNLRPQAKLNVTFMNVDPKPPLIGAIERHKHSMQLFVPMNGARYLAAICPPRPDGDPDLERLAVFVADGGQAVNYNAGTWHAPLTVLDRPGAFTMLRHDDGGPEDTDLVTLDAPIAVLLPE
ncbi:MAG: ureidoglycolate lyase [Alphaproteobacteria bacterium]|nr:ureidoglycolate lyase [Alphaproteobacteria bacterium]